MPTYVFLTTFTQQGAENIRDSPERTKHAKEMIESLGGTWREFFITMGRYDGIVIAEFPDDATAAQAVFTLAESANVTIEPLRAFSLGEFRDIVDAMS
ncbi:GYD domain-containing protein [Natrialbaceae archaeon A-gly3]